MAQPFCAPGSTTVAHVNPKPIALFLASKQRCEVRLKGQQFIRAGAISRVVNRPVGLRPLAGGLREARRWRVVFFGSRDILLQIDSASECKP